jgi:hypothetical protein
MMSLLVRPWLRLPRLLAIYGAIAVGAPCALFVAYELASLFRSFEAFGEYLNSKAVLLAIIVVAFLVIPYIYRRLTNRRNEQEFPYSPELAGSLTRSLFATLSFGLYLQERSEHAQDYSKILYTMRFMIKNADRITLSDEHIQRLQETKNRLEQSDETANSEFYTLLKRFLAKYYDAHHSRHVGGISRRRHPPLDGPNGEADRRR